MNKPVKQTIAIAICSTLAALPAFADKSPKVYQQTVQEQMTTGKIAIQANPKVLGTTTKTPSKKPPKKPGRITNTAKIPTHKVVEAKPNPKLINHSVAKLPTPAKITHKKPSPKKPAKVPLAADTFKQPNPAKINTGKVINEQRLAAIREANAGKGAQAARELGDTTRNVPGAPEASNRTNPELGLGKRPGKGLGGNAMDLAKLPGHDAAGFERPEGTELLPDLPSNQSKGPSNGALKPGGDLGGIMAGAASSGNQIETLNKDGSTTVVTFEMAGENENKIVTTTTRDADGSLTYLRHTVVQPDGTSRYDASTDGETGVVVDLTEAIPAETQDPNSDTPSSEIAEWARQFDHSKKGEAPTINYVNPGPDGGQTNPKAPRMMLPEDMLVINPSPEHGGTQARTLSEEEQAMMRERLAAKVKGPGGHPGDNENAIPAMDK